LLEPVVELADAGGHLIDFPGVAAEQVVAQGEAVLHHLRPDGLDRPHLFQGILGHGLALALLVPAKERNHEQESQQDQHGPEAVIESLADRHC
jgi:hypothetical protein